MVGWPSFAGFLSIRMVERGRSCDWDEGWESRLESKRCSFTSTKISGLSDRNWHVESDSSDELGVNPRGFLWTFERAHRNISPRD